LPCAKSPAVDMSLLFPKNSFEVFGDPILFEKIVLDFAPL